MAAKKPKKSAEPASQGQRKIISENRKARFKYEILEQIECGIVLVGSEVKSLRQNLVSLEEAYVRVKEGELWLVGADIAEYPQATLWNHDRRRTRKLLAQAGQIRKLAVRAQEKGFTLIPLQFSFNERGIIKVLVGVGRGKKLHDKRQTLKSKDANRSIDRELKRRR